MKSGNDRKIQDFYSHLDLPTFEDKTVLKFLPDLKRLASLSTDMIASTVKDSLMDDPETGISLVESLLDKGDLMNAYRKYKKLSRYHEGLDPEIFRLQTVQATDPKERIISHLRQKMVSSQSNRDALIACYHALSNCYAGNGQTGTAKAIKEWLGQ